MRTRSAIGYLRVDVSGSRREYDEDAMWCMARLLRMDLTLVVYDYADDRDPGRILSLLRVEGADAVLVPRAEHFSDNDIEALFPLAEVFCIEEKRLYTIHGADSTEHEGTLRITDIAERIAEVESWA